LRDADAFADTAALGARQPTIIANKILRII
jgi:hypothetical protein